MYCPRCGQQQVSDEVRFCSRCGFPTAGVRQLLAAGGVIPALEVKGSKPPRSPRYEGVRQGMILIFITMALLPFGAAAGRFGNTIVPMILMAGLMRMLYAAIFQEGASCARKQDASAPDSGSVSGGELNPEARRAALPPQPATFPAKGWRRTDTAEMVERPSVTENTTKLLDDSAQRN